MLFTNKSIIENSNATHFCECCLKENPVMNDGLTTCCLEYKTNKLNALKFATRKDILIEIQKTFKDAKAFGNLYFRDDAIFKIDETLILINLISNNRNEDIEVQKKVIKELRENNGSEKAREIEIMKLNILEDLR